MALSFRLVLLQLLLLPAAATPPPGGPYGLARTPPLGFRTWNAYQDRVDQGLMDEVIAAMVAKQPDGRSLADLGFRDVGLDDGWQSCGGPGSFNGSHHTITGDVLVNLTRFPNIKTGVVDRAHSLNLTAGFYFNNCLCSVPSQDRGGNTIPETGAWPAWSNASWLEASWRGNVRFLKEGGWDGVKVDNGGPFSDSGVFGQRTNQSWAKLLLAAQLPMVLEDCNMDHFPTANNVSCPYNIFRTSRDIRPNWGSIMNNLATMVPFLGASPLSRPSCWGYPDMLQVASSGDPSRRGDGTGLTAEEDRSHFGAWAIVSSPLTIGFDVTNKTKMTQAWPIISNEEIIAVNQAWHGHPGRLVSTWNVQTPPLPPAPSPPGHSCAAGAASCVLAAVAAPSVGEDSWVVPVAGAAAGGALRHVASGLCVIGGQAKQQQLVLGTCQPGPLQTWVHELSGELHLAVLDKTMCAAVKNFVGPAVVNWQCNAGINSLFKFNSTDKSLCTASSATELSLCLVAEISILAETSVDASPADPGPVGDLGGCLDAQGDSAVCRSAFSLWTKPQAEGGHAVFLLSNQPPTAPKAAINITFASISLALAQGRVAVRDLYTHKNLGEFESSYTTTPIGGHDSRFLLITPVAMPLLPPSPPPPPPPPFYPHPPASTMCPDCQSPPGSGGIFPHCNPKVKGCPPLQCPICGSGWCSGAGCCCSTLYAPPCPDGPSWLTCRARQIVDGSRMPLQAKNSSGPRWLFTPDATHSYGRQWTRDFYYTVSGAPELMDAADVAAAVRFTFAAQRADGCMPDSVEANGTPHMAPGPFGPAVGGVHLDHALDNGPFAALLLATTARTWPAVDPSLFCDLEPAARRGLDFVNRSAASGLAYNSQDSPNCTYGFTDGIVKTGELLFTSLLYIDASTQMAELSAAHSCGNSTQYQAEAAQVSASIDRMKDNRNGSGSSLWLAATHDGALPDVWGSAYLVALNLSTPSRRQAAMAAMVAQPDLYFEGGSVRSLPAPLTWPKCFYKCWSEGDYQNGGFWSTALLYVVPAMIATGHSSFADTLFSDVVQQMKEHGIYEWQNVNRTVAAVGNDACWCKLPCARCNGKPGCREVCNGAFGVYNYTASVTNVLKAGKLLASGRSSSSHSSLQSDDLATSFTARRLATFTVVEVDVEEFGAKADGKTECGAAFNAALGNVSSRGGGIVHARGKGSYLVTPIAMQNHTVLQIAAGTFINATRNCPSKDFPTLMLPRPAKCGGMTNTSASYPACGTVLFAANAHNFSIRGGGSIDGGGLAFDGPPYTHPKGPLMQLWMCSDAIVEDLRLFNSANVHIAPVFSQRMHFRRLYMYSDFPGPHHKNTDGWNPYSSSDLSLADSYIHNGDDCVAVKSGKQPSAWQCDTPSENILVKNVTCAGSHGLTIGSEVAGGIRNVTFLNVRIHGADGQPSSGAIKFKLPCGRGAYVKDILYDNVIASDVASGIMLAGDGQSCSKNGTTVVTNVTIRNVHAQKIAGPAFAIDGYTVVGRSAGYTPFSVKLENITMLDYAQIGTCSHATVQASAVNPAVPTKDATCVVSPTLR